MSDNETLLKFDFESYIASLMEAMDMGKASPEIQQDVTLQLGRQLGYRIMNTLTLNFSEEDWSGLTHPENATDLSELLSEAIERNPEIKEKLVEELDEFFTETVEAYNALKNA